MLTHARLASTSRAPPHFAQVAHNFMLGEYFGINRSPFSVVYVLTCELGNQISAKYL